MCAMEAALEGGSVDRIDFGWGDDPYKRDWLPDRAQRYGLAAYNIRTPLGAAMAVRNLVPGRARRLLRAAGRSGEPPPETAPD
jgi:CelD/BcsL family acetyltransferase involved in cellulose biosynthesis